MSMYQKKLKEALIEKINKYEGLWHELGKIDLEWDEETGQLISGSAKSVDELEELQFEYDSISTMMMDLREEIDELFLKTQFFPLVGVKFDEARKLKPFSTKAFWKNMPKDQGYDLIIDKFLTGQLEEYREGMKRRLGKMKFKPLPATINPRIYALYRQAIQSYLFGNFEAACALSRAIAEGIAKAHIEKMGFGRQLHGGKKSRKSMSTAGILKTMLHVRNNVLRDYSRVVGKADKILHDINEIATEKDALESLKSLNSYIKNFPKGL